MEDDQLHVVMLPWATFGHLVPFFQLSLALAKSGLHVSFVSTQKNIERLPNVPSHLASLLTMVSLPMPDFQNGDFPKGAEASGDVPIEKSLQWPAAYDLLKHPFEEFLANQQRPDWIVLDLLSHWAIEIAENRKIPFMLFSAVSATTLVFNGPPQYLTGEGRVSVRPSPESLMSAPNWVDFPSKISLKKHEAIAYFDALYVSKANGISLGDRFAKVLKSCHAVCVRTCNEYEQLSINLVTKLLGKPVIPTGVLPRDKPNGITYYESSWNPIFNWLDKQKPKSIVFVGFGSECRFSKDQIHEIAYGLELSEVSFLWAMGKLECANDEKDALPNGFGERTRGKGVVKVGWAPQLEILAHSSIGGSLFHSGWGSAIEILQFGHCLVVLPMLFDQCMNARFLVEMGLAVEIQRSQDGSFNRYDIAKALKRAMVSKEGEPLRTRAKEAAKIFGDVTVGNPRRLRQRKQKLK